MSSYPTYRSEPVTGRWTIVPATDHSATFLLDTIDGEVWRLAKDSTGEFIWRHIKDGAHIERVRLSKEYLELARQHEAATNSEPQEGDTSKNSTQSE